MSADSDEMFGKPLGVYDRADDQPADEAFVRELLNAKDRSHGRRACKFGEIHWRRTDIGLFWIDIYGNGSHAHSDFTRRQLRNLVNAMKGE